ncbi:hypothetical protein NC653_008401 [Populus alba x Populus x berolinensis]|uniref:Uncharacterized protein n=1 Tax=Populus alba x Populus x berolinensis TaxID=444605 RepID=A0AAD6R685_9ROSI|nr:hypothetical protein NC653_008401 [Populus alba x Populus x berolinensis]
MRGRSGDSMPPKNTIKGQHHKLDMGHIEWLLGISVASLPCWSSCRKAQVSDRNDMLWNSEDLLHQGKMLRCSEDNRLRSTIILIMLEYGHTNVLRTWIIAFSMRFFFCKSFLIMCT